MPESPMPLYELVSTVLCPHAQRAAILFAEKSVPFKRTYLDPKIRPDWFKAASPLGRLPLLRIGGRWIFELGAICEFIEEAAEPKLLPADPVMRAENRMWAETANAAIADIFGLYSAATFDDFEVKRQELKRKFAWLSGNLRTGPYLGDSSFTLADAALAPVLRLIDIIEDACGVRILDGERLDDYRAALRQRRSVREAVVDDYAAQFSRYLTERGSYLSTLVAGGRTGHRS